MTVESANKMLTFRQAEVVMEFHRCVPQGVPSYGYMFMCCFRLKRRMKSSAICIG